MNSKKMKFDDLVEEALENAKSDRSLALDAFESLKPIFEDIDRSKPESMQAVLLIGANAVKLLEQSSRSNEQVIKLAQLKEKESRAKETEEDTMQFTLEDIKNAAAANKQ